MTSRHPAWDTPEGQAFAREIGMTETGMVERLAARMNLAVVDGGGGIRVKPICGGMFYLDILFMLFENRRLVMATPSGFPVRAWCYRGPRAFELAYISAIEWPESDPDWTPEGWFKDPIYGEVQSDWFQPGPESVDRLSRIYAAAREEQDEGEES